MKRMSVSELHFKAELALKAAIKDVIKDHKRTGLPLIIWRDGKVVKVSANRISSK